MKKHIPNRRRPVTRRGRRTLADEITLAKARDEIRKLAEERRRLKAENKARHAADVEKLLAEATREADASGAGWKLPDLPDDDGPADAQPDLFSRASHYSG